MDYQKYYQPPSIEWKFHTDWHQLVCSILIEDLSPPSCAINNQVDYFTDYWVVCKRNQCHGNGLREVNPVLSLESGRSPHSFLFVGSGGGSFGVLKPPSVHGSSLANSDKRWRCDEYCETYWDLPAAHWAGFNMLTGRRHTLALRCTVMVQSWTSDLIWSY